MIHGLKLKYFYKKYDDSDHDWLLCKCSDKQDDPQYRETGHELNASISRLFHAQTTCYVKTCQSCFAGRALHFFTLVRNTQLQC
jgi:hypothetical protein